MGDFGEIKCFEKRNPAFSKPAENYIKIPFRCNRIPGIEKCHLLFNMLFLLIGEDIAEMRTLLFPVRFSKAELCVF
jgi:hypothetical protein